MQRITMLSMLALGLVLVITPATAVSSRWSAELVPDIEPFINVHEYPSPVMLEGARSTSEGEASLLEGETVFDLFEDDPALLEETSPVFMPKTKPVQLLSAGVAAKTSTATATASKVAVHTAVAAKVSTATKSKVAVHAAASAKVSTATKSKVAVHAAASAKAATATATAVVSKAKVAVEAKAGAKATATATANAKVTVGDPDEARRSREFTEVYGVPHFNYMKGGKKFGTDFRGHLIKRMGGSEEDPTFTMNENRMGIPLYPPADNIHWARNKNTGIARTGIHDYYSAKEGVEDQDEEEDHGLDPEAHEPYVRIEDSVPAYDNIHWAVNKQSGLGRTGLHDYYGDDLSHFGRHKKEEIEEEPHDLMLWYLDPETQFNPNYTGSSAERQWKNTHGRFELTVGQEMNAIEKWTIFHGTNPYLFSLAGSDYPADQVDPAMCPDGVDYTMPDGLALSDATGAVSGNPTTPWEGCVVVQLEETRSYEGQPPQKAYVVVVFVIYAAITIEENVPSFSMEFQQDEPWSTSVFDISGGRAPWKTSAHTTLPAGLVMSKDKIHGTATEIYLGKATVGVIDVNGSTDTCEIDLQVHAKCKAEPPFATAFLKPLDGTTIDACNHANEDPCVTQCLTGYEKGAGPLTCDEFGDWQVTPCTPMVCDASLVNFATLFVEATDLTNCDNHPKPACNTTPIKGYTGGGPLDCSLGLWSLPPAKPMVCTGTPPVTDYYAKALGDYEPCNDFSKPACGLSCQSGYEGTPQVVCGLNDAETGVEWQVTGCTIIHCTPDKPAFGANFINDRDVSTCDDAPEPPCEGTCMSGYERDSGKPSVECNLSGTWSVSGCQLVDCAAESGAAPTIANSESYDSTLCDTSIEGVCQITCQDGYQGSPQVDCGMDGAWAASGSCQAIQCASTPDFLGNGLKTVDLSACDTVPDAACAGVTCIDGYEGSPSLECSGTGEWVISGCTPKVCPTITAGAFPEGGDTTNLPSPSCVKTAPGDNPCALSCDDAYSGSLSIECADTGDWVWTGQCSPKTCDAGNAPTPANIDTADLTNCDEVRDGSCSVGCAYGYEGGVTFTCVDQDTWQTVGQCTAMTCSAPSTALFTDGDFAFTYLGADRRTSYAACDTVPEGECELACAPGYRRVDGVQPTMDCVIDQSGSATEWITNGGCELMVCDTPVPSSFNVDDSNMVDCDAAIDPSCSVPCLAQFTLPPSNGPSTTLSCTPTAAGAETVEWVGTPCQPSCAPTPLATADGVDTSAANACGSGWLPHGQQCTITCRDLWTPTSDLDTYACDAGVATQSPTRACQPPPKCSAAPPATPNAGTMTVTDAVQNSGKCSGMAGSGVQLDSISDGASTGRKNACLAKCALSGPHEACELVYTGDNQGCFVYTEKPSGGDGSSNICWIGQDKIHLDCAPTYHASPGSDFYCAGENWADSDQVIFEGWACVLDSVAPWLLNGSFEQTTVLPDAYDFYSSEGFPGGWRAVGGLAVTKVELQTTCCIAGEPKAHTGDNYAEMNAEMVADLYQDVSTPQGTTYAWKTFHRGRFGVDVATLSFTIQETGKVLHSVTLSDDETAWGEYSGSIYIPYTGTVRVQFHSVSATGACQSCGNFIEDVCFHETDCDQIY